MPIEEFLKERLVDIADAFISVSSQVSNWSKMYFVIKDAQHRKNC
jgi:hypothetical protein